ncbi:MAG TPA: hypothetical protein VIS49_15025 [Cyclobacteriaceae bacterium]
MKLVEKSDSEKKKLIERSERYKREIEAEVDSISQSTERILTNALFIGGALALTYFAVTGLKGSEKKKTKKRKRQTENDEVEDSSEPSVMSQIGEVVITQATMVLLEFAKEKLAEYLQRNHSTDEDS